MAGTVFSHSSPLPLQTQPEPLPSNLVLQKCHKFCKDGDKASLLRTQTCVHSHTHTLTLAQTNFSSFACKSFQSPGMGSVHLCVAQQQVPIPFLSWCCGPGCAHPPSNLEVNPPQTSPGMPCWPCVCIWESPCAFLPIFSSMCFISAIPDGIHT